VKIDPLTSPEVKGWIKGLLKPPVASNYMQRQQRHHPDQQGKRENRHD
jgi:hypothetical protein